MNLSSLYEDPQICVVGLGYVGLPLAAALGKNFNVVGFDINPDRVAQLSNGIDKTNELSATELKLATKLYYTSDPKELSGVNCFIITVPTPIDEEKKPDLRPLKAASELVGKVLSKGNIVIFESTVFPGCTEEECVPILEIESRLKYNSDFVCGYSPERINPGDKERSLSSICKVISASTDKGLEFMKWLYGTIVYAELHEAPSIKVAEAAKIIENTQRDINIALMNELAILFNKLGIDTSSVLEAASTKWNFYRFTPGLVGGHCIGVDPYYLTHKAQSVGYIPEMILAGRRINEGMSRFVCTELIKKLAQRKEGVVSPKILVLGYTFKENCPDVRNTKVKDMLQHLQEFQCKVSVYDPHIGDGALEKMQDVTHVQNLVCDEYDAIIIAVAHDEFRKLDAEYLRSLSSKNCIVYDLKNIFPIEHVDMRL